MQKNSAKPVLQIFKRFYVKIALLLFAFIFLALFVIFAGINDIKYEISTLNLITRNNIVNTFVEVKDNITTKARLIANGVEPFYEDTVVSKFYAAFYVIAKDNSLLYERKFEGAFELHDYDIAWFSDIKAGEFRLSDRFYKNRRFKDIYIAYGLKNGNKILVQLNQNLLKNKVDTGYNKNLGAYVFLVDKDGNLSRDEFYRKFIKEDFNKYISQGGEFKADKIIFKLKDMNFYKISYLEEQKLFVITGSSRQAQIFIQLVLVVLSFLCFVAFSILWLRDNSYIKDKILSPFIRIALFAADKSKPTNEEFDIKEFTSLNNSIKKLYEDRDKAYETAQSYESRFGYVFEKSFLKIVVYDAYTGVITDISNALLENLGYKKDDVADLNIKELLEDESKNLAEDRENAINNNLSYEAKLRRKNGEIIDVLVTQSSFELENTRLNFILIKDITQEKMTQRNDDIIKSYVFLSPNVIAIASAKEPFLIIQSTNNVERIFNVQSQGLINLEDIIASEDFDSFKAAVLASKKAFLQASFKNEELNFIANMTNAYGKKIPFKIKAKFIDAEGQKVIYSFTDLSDMLKLQERFEKQSKESKALLWASEANVFTWDKRSDMLNISDELSKILGTQSTLNFEQAKSVFVDEFDSFYSFFESLRDAQTYIKDIKLYSIDKEILHFRLRAKALEYDEFGEVSLIKGTLRDLSLEDSFFVCQDLLAKIFSFSKEEVVLLDEEMRVIDANDAFFESAGAKDSVYLKDITFIKQGLSDIKHQIIETINQGGSWSGKVWSENNKNKSKLEVIEILPLIDANEKRTGYIMLAMLANNEAQNEKYLEFIAYHDPLTKLPNRFLLYNKLNSLIQKNEQKIAVIYLDMDDFKSINDNFGHQIGDKFLVAISEKIGAMFNGKNIFARIGGDEFVGVINYENLGEVYEIAQNMLRLASDEVKIDELKLKASASVGIALADSELGADDVLQRADWAMYQAKISGKNRSYTFDAKKDVYFKSQYEDGSKILKALDAGEMFLEFQPEISFSTGETLSFEALIRWRKDGEIIYPSDFLPLIKTSSASSNIALFTIKEALLARKMWLENGISAKVRVNLSVKKLFTEEFWHKFKAIFEEDKSLDPTGLIIDVIDAATATNLEVLEIYVRKYKELGIHFSLDDFASYSSSIEALGMLKTNRFNIDNKFCKHIFSSKEALESINMIRFVADKFGLNATIKNIDDKRTLEFLLGLGFDKFQGNIFSLALLAKDAASFKFERPYLHIKDYKNSENFELFKGLVVLKELANEVIANLNQDDKLAQSLKQKIEDEIKNIGKFNQEISINLSKLASSSDSGELYNLAMSIIKECDINLGFSKEIRVE